MKPPVTFTLDPEIRPPFDFIVVDHGSIVTFSPVTAEAEIWWDENVAPDGPVLGNQRAVEHRFAPAIYEAIQQQGFKA